MITKLVSTPVWHPAHGPIMPPPPAHMLDWLKTQILSKALRKMVPNLALNVVQQALGQPHLDEAEKLKLNHPQDLPLIRQVNIGTPNATNLYCRVVVPPKLYEQEQHTFDTLGTRFIGETLLYNQPGVHRSGFEYAVLDLNHILYQEALRFSRLSAPLNPILYARRSLFHLPILPLLITEVFVHVVALS